MRDTILNDRDNKTLKKLSLKKKSCDSPPLRLIQVKQTKGDRKYFYMAPLLFSINQSINSTDMETEEQFREHSVINI